MKKRIYVGGDSAPEYSMQDHFERGYEISKLKIDESLRTRRINMEISSEATITRKRDPLTGQEFLEIEEGGGGLEGFRLGS